MCPPSTPQGVQYGGALSAAPPGVVGVLNQPQTPQAMQQLLQTPQRQAPRVTVPGSAMSAGSVGKPQQLWRDEINNSDQPFVPKLRSKPNAIAPFEARPARASRDLHPLTFDLPRGFDRRASQLRVEHGAEEVPGRLGLTPGGSSPRRQPSSWCAEPSPVPRACAHAHRSSCVSRYANPYAAELAEFHPTEVQLLPRETGMPAPLHQTPCMCFARTRATHQRAPDHTTQVTPRAFGGVRWVATEQALHAVVQKLSGVDEFGVAVVEHSYRSYRGFIALMQAQPSRNRTSTLESGPTHVLVPPVAPSAAASSRRRFRRAMRISCLTRWSCGGRCPR